MKAIGLLKGNKGLQGHPAREGEGPGVWPSTKAGGGGGCGTMCGPHVNIFVLEREILHLEVCCCCCSLKPDHLTRHLLSPKTGGGDQESDTGAVC